MIAIERTLSVVRSALLLIGGVHIGARALLDINLIWFGYISRLSHEVGRGRGFYSFNVFAALRGRGGGGVSTLYSYDIYRGNLAVCPSC
jgi:hypothetical protein